MTKPQRFSLGSAALGAPARPSQRSWYARGWLWVGLITVLLIVGMGGSFFWLGARFTQALQFENTPISFFEGIRLVGEGIFASPKELKGFEDGRINILLLGRAGEHHPGKDLTDTIMLLSLNTKTHQAALLSLPRDLLAPLPESNTSVKINTLYQYGLSAGKGARLIEQSIETMTGLPVHYFVTIDFDGFEQVIDALGGIRVEVARDIHDTRYPGPNYSYETFDLKQGWQTLDGKTALKYARMRHADPEGDFGRAKRQQQILQAVRTKAWSLPTFINPITLTHLLESLGRSVDTDITPEAARAFMTLVNNIDTRAIATVVVDAWKPTSLLRVVHVDTHSGPTFALSPRSGTWKEIEAQAKHIFEADTTKTRERYIKAEDASVLIVVPDQDTSLAQDLMRDIKATFPISQVAVRVWPALDMHAPASIIGDTHTVLFTLDSLINRYDLRHEPDTSIALPAYFPAADVVILYTRTNIPGLKSATVSEDSFNDFPEAE